MPYNPKIASTLVQAHGRAIAQMRERHAARRFGLVFGAGLGQQLGFPRWDDLLAQIAAHPEVAAGELTRDRDVATYRSQLLFQHFRTTRLTQAPAAKRGTIELEYDIEVRWKQIVHSVLYGKVDHARIDSRDHYLAEFLPIIRTSPLTINYNFDDTIERMLLATRTPEESRQSRGYSTLWSANAQIKASEAVVYHPNGFLPFRLAEQQSEDIVLLEESFADQLIASTSGYYSTLTSHLAQTTCLFIGLSLDDPTLRHLLRQTARVFPGHYHYYVAYRENYESGDQARRNAECDTNFRVHNLITLFLNDDQLMALGRVLAMSDDEYRSWAVTQLGRPQAYRFFLTGPVGVGKTTALARLRSLRTLDEWIDPLLDAMTRDASDLSPEDVNTVDRWVDQQVEKKNNRLWALGPGVDVIDRSPLDAFAFIPEEMWAARAASMRDALQGQFSDRSHIAGHVIVLTGDPDVIAPRARRVMRTPSIDSLQRQEDVLRRLYPPDDSGVTYIDTRERSPAEVARAIAAVIHRAPYAEFDFQKCLEILAAGGGI